MRGIERKGGALLAVVLLAGCGYAKRVEVTQQIDQVRTDLRSELKAGDDAVGGQVTALGGRVDQNTQRIAALERDLGALRNDFNVRIQRVEGRMEGLVTFNVPVHFEFDAKEIRPADRPVLERFASIVKTHYGASKITVEGFTDPAGSVAYNRRLGLARAEAVKAFLVEQGVSPDQLRTVSYGEARDRLIDPAAGGPGEKGMQNRRVVFVIDTFGGARPTTN